ncbi:MAG: hypothetical protein K4305_00450 [Chlorobium sp.]|uniref:hypothetical protein n=1 Tax=Chlorobium sp. TaxID=1095 RepID=UPI002F3F91E1
MPKTWGRYRSMRHALSIYRIFVIIHSIPAAAGRLHPNHATNYHAGIIQLHNNRGSRCIFHQRHFFSAAPEQVHRKKFGPEKCGIGRIKRRDLIIRKATPFTDVLTH